MGNFAPQAAIICERLLHKHHSQSHERRIFQNHFGLSSIFTHDCKFVSQDGHFIGGGGGGGNGGAGGGNSGGTIHNFRPIALTDVFAHAPLTAAVHLIFLPLHGHYTLISLRPSCRGRERMAVAALRHMMGMPRKNRACQPCHASCYNHASAAEQLAHHHRHSGGKQPSISTTAPAPPRHSACATQIGAMDGPQGLPTLRTERDCLDLSRPSCISS